MKFKLSLFLILIFLDGDIEPLIDSNGILTSRDIVQFVNFHEIENNDATLTDKVLEEIPKQIEDYFNNFQD